MGLTVGSGKDELKYWVNSDKKDTLQREMASKHLKIAPDPSSVNVSHQNMDDHQDVPFGMPVMGGEDSRVSADQRFMKPTPKVEICKICFDQPSVSKCTYELKSMFNTVLFKGCGSPFCKDHGHPPSIGLIEGILDQDNGIVGLKEQE
mmetsp:Transcript_10051/g.15331  ORF Transcript_10051/g.15331 Transcript_10051/m.15331 type:complete len:148 (+) Transcript_10051:271-714(+)|eukprot:CAMPEP_0170483252 /NCGR_PEP_ID=MMETSP0208-20121228/2953_1 /TAXON_ID=197538 /ORGANISM="Strombidium inclinatum, Strain S3" /LENGTH=147 /DNA_ID=CAMNT_0010756211 /DNA_START=207 /DNA_END=650 /DNA_ORIENTATION=+